MTTMARLGAAPNAAIATSAHATSSYTRKRTTSRRPLRALDERGDFAHLRRDQRRFGEHVAHGFGGLEAVARYAEHDFVIGAEQTAFRERPGGRDGDAAGGLGEDSRRLGEEPDTGNESVIAHRLARAAALAHRVRG